MEIAFSQKKVAISENIQMEELRERNWKWNGWNIILVMVLVMVVAEIKPYRIFLVFELYFYHFYRRNTQYTPFKQSSILMMFWHISSR